jgi:uncharacterized protein with HEPN domain
MIHFYHEISYRELFEICTSELADIKDTIEALKRWIKENPEKIDEYL